MVVIIIVIATRESTTTEVVWPCVQASGRLRFELGRDPRHEPAQRLGPHPRTESPIGSRASSGPASVWTKINRCLDRAPALTRAPAFSKQRRRIDRSQVI